MTGVGHFADRLCEAIARRGNAVVGLDPRLESLPEALVEACRATYGSTTRAPKRCGVLTVTLLTRCTIWCPWSNRNWRSMNATASPACRRMCRRRCARDAGLLVIADGKRNDIGPTAVGYAGISGPQVFEQTVPGDFEVDALTVNAFLGGDGHHAVHRPGAAAWPWPVRARENVQCLVG